MDNINQIERLCYAKICGKKHCFMTYSYPGNRYPGKSEKLETTIVTARFSPPPPVFFSEAAP